MEEKLLSPLPLPQQTAVAESQNFQNLGKISILHWKISVLNKIFQFCPKLIPIKKSILL
jgi:hypothetical protein